MTDIQEEIERALSQAVTRAFGSEVGQEDPLIRPADPRFGDYQANLPMSLGKKLSRPPREVAQAIVEALDAPTLFDKVAIAGPGFINLSLMSSAITRWLGAMSASPRLSIPEASRKQRVVIDYAAPNLAKEMHVGHLRSSVIGDALARTLEFRGHTVIRQNHVGDWGTQFGMLLEHLSESTASGAGDQHISDLNTLYQLAQTRFKSDAAFADRARRRVVALQAGEPEARRIWGALIAESVRHMNQVFERLGVLLTDHDLRPESAYNDALPDVVRELKELGILVESEGAEVTFPDGFFDRDGKPVPLIVKKRDGGFGYAATDLAAARYRIRELEATRLVYVVDSRQADHFSMLFWTLRRAGWAKGDVALDYVPFGTILGPEKKPFRTREGDTVRLLDLLDQAVDRARQAIAAKNPDLPSDESNAIAEAVGVGAVKYADLSSDRIKDYVFDLDRMLALEGNTAPYLQNAYVRIRSIFRRGDVASENLSGENLAIEQAAERRLAVQLLRLPRAVESVESSLEPHRLCGFLYDLASSFHQFYEECPVLKASDEASRLSRLALSDLTARTLALGLSLLGIRTVEQM